jgi:hypothetical protein
MSWTKDLKQMLNEESQEQVNECDDYIFVFGHKFSKQDLVDAGEEVKVISDSFGEIEISVLSDS